MALDNTDIIANPYIARHESIFNECSRSNIEEPLFQPASNRGWVGLSMRWGEWRLCRKTFHGLVVGLVGMGARGAGDLGEWGVQWGVSPRTRRGCFARGRRLAAVSARSPSRLVASGRSAAPHARSRDPPPGRCDAPPTDQHTPHPTTRRRHPPVTSVGTVRCTVYTGIRIVCEVTCRT